MTEEQLQTIKEHFLNTPDGYTISGSVRLIEQMKDNGISLVNELELQKANAEQYLQDNVELHNENLILNNEIQRLSLALDRTELAEVKARIEIEAGEGYLTALLKKRILQINNLQDENENLRGALQEYAAKENYERVENDPDIYEGGYSQPTWEPSWIELDNGETARKALAGESK